MNDRKSHDHDHYDRSTLAPNILYVARVSETATLRYIEAFPGIVVPPGS